VRGNPVEDACAIALEFASGALGTVSVSDTVVAPWSWEQTTGENPAFPQTDQCCFQIGGTHGALSIPKLEIWSNEGKRSWLEPLKVERVHAPRKDPLRLQVEQFCRVIRGEEAPLVPGSEGLATLRVIAAIQEAARGGARVRL
jgi:predicted dehydrogenase